MSIPLPDSVEWPVLAPGMVWLAGAGPGDPGLLTLHGLNGLQQADVIVYDALVDKRILAFAKPGARLDYAGKRGGKPSPEQRDICEHLVALAKSGKRVLRLKGGDPLVFGRGGEEALALAQAGIPFRIIPGITTGIGGLAYAGIPVTHRDTNQVVTFVTGHRTGGDVPDTLDWTAIAHGSPVIVVYMGLIHLSQIASALIEAGRDPDEPAAVISHATLPRQKVVVTTIARMAADAADAGCETPAILVVGPVVNLRAGLDWLGAGS